MILTRKQGEVIRIGKDIEVVIMAVKGPQVRVGVKAPRDVTVDREEIALKRATDPRS